MKKKIIGGSYTLIVEYTKEHRSWTGSPTMSGSIHKTQTRWRCKAHLKTLKSTLSFDIVTKKHYDIEPDKLPDFTSELITIEEMSTTTHIIDREKINEEFCKKLETLVRSERLKGPLFDLCVQAPTLEASQLLNEGYIFDHAYQMQLNFA